MQDTKISGLGSEIIPLEELSLSLDEWEELEELSKACPRCGGKSANSSNPSGRCRSCLNKLAANKKKPGHYLHNHKVADDALRRQDGKTKTASKKSKGRGSRKEIISKLKSAEKKAGQVLSPDRIKNDKGYASSNVRMVPKELNRGRHHVDEKKLKAWKKRLKKHDLNVDELYTLMKAKFQDNEEVMELLKSLSAEGLEQYIDLFDAE